jgi:hypothetical protein
LFAKFDLWILEVGSWACSRVPETSIIPAEMAIDCLACVAPLMSTAGNLQTNRKKIWIPRDFSGQARWNSAYIVEIKLFTVAVKWYQQREEWVNRQLQLDSGKVFS